jgi:hypothetical protein
VSLTYPWRGSTLQEFFRARQLAWHHDNTAPFRHRPDRICQLSGLSHKMQQDLTTSELQPIVCYT